MLILGIDTSCDDTCIAVLKIENSKMKILSNVVSSQVKLHAKYGGVWPFLAKREHKRNLPIVFKKTFRQVEDKLHQKHFKFDILGVTVGPGLEPCLWEGVNFAKNLAKKLKIPLIPVNHLEAHILINFINEEFETLNYKLKTKFFPAICLVVSGGHTILFLMKKIGKYQFIGETRDDAAGECFDKVARVLGLGYPGGPALAAKAAAFKVQSSKFKVKLPRPMIYHKNYDFSFSGLKTAVLYDFKKRKIRERKSRAYIQEMAKEIQQAVIDVLIFKTLKATKEFKAKSLIVGGGVAANSELKRQFKEKIKKEIPNSKFYIPDSKYCTDNALMVALAGFFNRQKIKKPAEIKAEANLKI